MKYILAILILFPGIFVNAQEVDSDLMAVKERLDNIQSFEVDILLNLDVSFINMPEKRASMHYERDKPVKFSSDDFVMIPKRGLDFSFRELFQYSFMTVPLGTNESNGVAFKKMHVIPTDDRSDLVMVTLDLDTSHQRIVSAQVNTKKDGSYFLQFKYAENADILPEDVEVTFQIERIRIPFNFIGKDTQIDRKEMKEEGEKEGKIFLKMTNYRFM